MLVGIPHIKPPGRNKHTILDETQGASPPAPPFYSCLLLFDPPLNKVEVDYPGRNPAALDTGMVREDPG